MVIFRRRWVLPTLLTGVVIALVASTRRAAASTAAPANGTPPPATSSEGGAREPLETRTPGSAAASTTTTTPATTPATNLPPEVIESSAYVLDVYNSLMGAMQADIHSVEPSLLENLARRLDALGLHTQARFADQRAQCAREVRGESDPDFFPLSCATHPPVDAGPAAVIVPPDLLKAYSEAMSKNLYGKAKYSRNAIPTDKAESSISVDRTDVLTNALRAVPGLASEAQSLRDRRDRLYKQKFDNAIAFLPRAQEGAGIDFVLDVARELSDAGYQTPYGGDALNQAIGNRRTEIGTRRTFCNVGRGRPCHVLDPNDVIKTIEELPDRTLVTDHPERASGGWSFITFDPLRSGGPAEGWVLTNALTPV